MQSHPDYPGSFLEVIDMHLAIITMCHLWEARKHEGRKGSPSSRQRRLSVAGQQAQLSRPFGLNKEPRRPLPDLRP